MKENLSLIPTKFCRKSNLTPDAGKSGRTFTGNRSEFNPSTLTRAERRLLSRLGLPQDSLADCLRRAPLAEGTHALVFEIFCDRLPSSTRLVAKAWKNPLVDSLRAVNENSALRILASQCFPYAPRPAGFLSSQMILLEEKATGVPIPTREYTAIPCFAQAVAHLHSIEVRSYGSILAEKKYGSHSDYLHDFVSRLRRVLVTAMTTHEYNRLVAGLLNRIDSDAERARSSFVGSTFSLIHFDLNPDNVLYLPVSDGIAIIDWEQASGGDCALDVAKLFFKCNFDDLQRTTFLAEYSQAMRHTDYDSFFSRLQIFHLLVLANSILWRVTSIASAPKTPATETEQHFYDRLESRLFQEIAEVRGILHRPEGR